MEDVVVKELEKDIQAVYLTISDLKNALDIKLAEKDAEILVLKQRIHILEEEIRKAKNISIYGL